MCNKELGQGWNGRQALPHHGKGRLYGDRHIEQKHGKRKRLLAQRMISAHDYHSTGQIIKYQ